MDENMELTALLFRLCGIFVNAMGTAIERRSTDPCMQLLYTVLDDRTD